MLTIQRFFSLLFVFVVVGLYSSFFAYYLDEQQTKADIIADEFHRTLNEMGYLLATELDDVEAIGNFKSLFNRKVVQNHLINAMIVAHHNDVLLTTNPSIQKTPQHEHSHSKHADIDSKKLLKFLVHEHSVQVYEQNRAVTLTVYLYPNHFALEEYFSEISDRYVVFSVLPTLIIALLLYWVLRVRLILPLEKLRQFAYYQHQVPNKLYLKELETIRSSMEQTFKRLEEESRALYKSATTDSLSDLPNRNQLEERLGWLISESERKKSVFAFLFLDLDNFKNINDTLGHDIGDKLILKVSKLMKELLRDYDIIARIGGDEFVIIINQYQNPLEVQHIIGRILAKISEIDSVESNPINVSASIGVACYPKDGISNQELMKHADIAMYEAKKLGKNQVYFFTENLHNKVIEQISVENELQKAIEKQEFELYYQPKVSLETGKIIGAESLIRWHNPLRGFVSPVDFIPIAEQSGLIVPLGDWILEQAIKQQKSWQDDFELDLHISVNVSAVQFKEHAFFSRLQALFNQYQVKLEKLDIEVTESVLMGDTEQSLSTLKKVKGLGVTISLDDFGTGYSSLAYLKAFPINSLKIDKSFIDDYQHRSGSVFIETMVNMAHNLNINVVAEGVEQQEQVSYLKEIGCEVYQGYYCSPPLPADQFLELVKENHKA
ncbi:MAG: EAL domain-containing protein [Pseudomonadota bacterium]|nr:EAL domain-containing protein [Pseudomonadota bacterium]